MRCANWNSRTKKDALSEALGKHDRKVSESVAKEIELEHTEETIRKAVVDALLRIDEGTDDKCQQCGASIPKARLDAPAFATYSVDCEGEVEAIIQT